jgi:RNA polymerase sigma-70 factor, ECF subfamily
MISSDPSAPAARLADEQQAIAQLKQGNLAGLATLVQTHQVRAVHTALLIVGDLATAEEVVQEAFLQAYAKIDQFDDRRPFAPWFLRSVIHAAIKTAQKQRRMEPLEEAPDPGPAAAWLIDPSLGPQEMVEAAEVHEAVWQAIAQLSPDQRAAVVLRYFLDKSEKEMIQELGRPLTTIKWWLHAGRLQLRRLLNPSHDIEMESQEVEHE